MELWRQFGNHLVDLQPKLKRDLSVLSRLSRGIHSADGEKAKERVLEKLNARKEP